MTTSHPVPDPSPKGRRRGVRALVATIGALIALVALAVPALAHVEAEGDTATTGITTVTFSFSHGCSGSPTTGLAIQLPAGTTEVTAQNPTGWSSAVADGTLTWTGGSIPDADEGTFVAEMRVVGSSGDTIFLPTVQICAAGEERWVERTDDPEAENAAPRITLTQTVAPAETTTSSSVAASTTTETSSASSSTATTQSDEEIVKDSDSSPVGTIVIIVVVAIIAIGALVLYLRNRKPSATP